MSLLLRSLRLVILGVIACLGLRGQVPAQDPLLKEFQSTYRRIVQEALNGSASDAQFWTNANRIVFGVREPTSDNVAARKLFEQKLFQLDFGAETGEAPEIYEADTPSGAKMERRLQEILERLRTKNPVTVEDLLELGGAAGPFLRALELGARGPVVDVPPKSVVTVRSRPFCLQHNAPAASGNAPMWLIPSDTLFPKQSRPIVRALAVHVSSHPADHGIVQSLLWAIRHADTQPLGALSKGQERVLNASLKDGAKRFLEYIAAVRSGSSNKAGQGKTKAPATKPAEVDDFGNPVDGGSALDLDSTKQTIIDENLGHAGIQHTGNPLNEADVDSIMRQLLDAGARELAAGAADQSGAATSTDGFNSLDAGGSSFPTRQEAAKPSGGKDSANDAYTLIDKQVAAELHTFNMGESTLRIANAGDKPYRYDFSEHVGLARRLSQPALLTPPPCYSPSEATLRKAADLSKQVGALLKEKEQQGALPLKLLHALFPALDQSKFKSGVVQELIKAVPVLGDIISICEVATGRDFFSGQALTPFQRGIQAISIPFIAVKAVKNVARLGEILSALRKGENALKFEEACKTLSTFARESEELLEKGVAGGWISKRTVDAVGDIGELVEPLTKGKVDDFEEAVGKVGTRRTLKQLGVLKAAMEGGH